MSGSTNLPSVATTPQILLRFNKKVSPALLTAIQNHLKSNDIFTLSIEYDKSEEESKDSNVLQNQGGGSPILAISSTQEELEVMAEQNRSVFPTAPERTLGSVSIMETFLLENRKRFISTGSDGLKFTSGQRITYCLSSLETIFVLNPGETKNALSKEFDEMGVHYLEEVDAKKAKEASSVTLPNGTIVRPNHSKYLIEVLEENELLESITPIHYIFERETILNESWNPMKKPPIQKIRDYYGDEVAFYFAWLSTFTLWLAIPAIGGIAVFFIRNYRGDTIETCELTPFFGFGVFLWASIYLRFWEREESRLAYQWGTFRTSDVGKAYQVRPEFEGELRLSPVTNRPEKYYSPIKRRLKYCVSALVTLAMLFLAFTVMIISLNLQGYVHPGHDEERWEEIPHPYFYPWVAHLSEEGQLFDVNSRVMSFVPSILHAITINTLNTIYRKIAERLTEWENHKSVVNHENSMILKRFLFEAFDCYIALFYLAFFERDIKKLRGELSTVFIIDTVRRMFLECIVPLVSLRISERKSKSANADRKKNDDWFDPTGTEEKTRFLKESTLEEYEQFDDYIEMVIEFGYITLFASAMPLASILALISNLVEIRTDCTKLARVLARPRAITTDSIGTWKSLISAIIYLSAMTNCLIFGLTSGQMMQFFPEWYEINEYGDRKFVKGKGFMVIIVMVLIERGLLLLNVLINALIPKTPSDVLEHVEKNEYIRTQEHKLLKFENKGKASTKKEE